LCTATGLTNATAYYFKVAAINAAGTGPYSSASAAITPIGTYALGDTGPGGGKVFYVASTPFACGATLGKSCKYLEVSPTGLWNPWCVGTLATTSPVVAFSSAIGAGYWNTNKMLADCTSGLAYDARATVRNLLTDWYLPNTGEWNAMYAERVMLGFFIDGQGYLASEDATTASAKELVGADGTWVTFSKISTHGAIHSRAIRAF
jgi:hypothetical protein